MEVELLEQRVRSGVHVARGGRRVGQDRVRRRSPSANAVGDLASLVGRLDSLGPVIASQREARKAEKAQRAVESKAAKEKIVAEAEKLATATTGAPAPTGCASLLDEWKALPRIDRASDDELWKRFSSARTTYTRRRKTHFAEQNEKREGARVVKERLAKEAEALADSTDWGPTAGPLPRPDAPVEGRRRRHPRTSTTSSGSGSAAPRTRSSVPGTPPTPPWTRSSPPTPRSRRSSWSRPRRCSRSPTSRPPRRRSATSPTAGTPPARCRATG